MEERYIAAVDLGTSKIALTVARVYGESVEIIFYKDTPSDCVRQSKVINPKRAAAPLKEIIRDAEEELGIKILQVVIGLPRFNVRQETASASMECNNASACISQEDVDAIKNLALDTYPLENPDKEEIYGAVTQSFSTDDMINLPEEDIVGMASDKLEGNFKIFVGTRKAVTNIDIMLNYAGVAPARKFFLPKATADAVLSYEEKENGVALIEMGAGVTSLSIYQRGILRQYTAIPFGGKVITTDIKFVCGFKEALAENIKMAYGACMPDRLLSMKDKIIQVEYNEDGGNKQVEVKYLSEIITARVREIVEALLYKIQESGYSDKLRNGIVLTGGCANLTGCANFIKELSGYNVRIGYPRSKFISASGYPGLSETSAAASVGMLLLAKEDIHLNCTTEPEVKAETKPETEPEVVEIPVVSDKVPAPEEATGDGTSTERSPAQETVAEPELQGTLFPEMEAEKPARKEEPSRKKAGRRYISWGERVIDKVSSLFESME